MSYRVCFEGSDKPVPIERNETVLEAAIRAGVAVNYGCNNGNCGLCLARRLNGCIRPVRNSDYVFEQRHRDGRHFLMCAAAACGDLRIDASLAAGDDSIPLQKFRAQIKKLQFDGGIVQMRLRVSRSHRLRFLAGQCALLHHAACGRGKYAIASCPCDAREMEFHLRTEDDAFAGALRRNARSGDAVEVTAPFGRFVFTEDMTRPIVLFAFDVGFAAVKSLIEHIVAQESELPVSLYRVYRGEKYLETLCRAWRDALDQLQYTPLAAADGGGAAWARRIAGRHRPLDGFDFYLSAPAPVSRTLKDFLIANGALKGRVFCQHTAAGGGIE